ncbi:MAG: acyl-CoA dehydrogenase family protein, partial [Deltaproteobacteria bacterium]|nr:acyl-CoA dehydrogenase family protein [Deltaproteobacteria bacterium]
MIDSILSEENKMFRDSVRKFAENEVAPHVKTWEKLGKYPEEYYGKLSEMGFMGLLVPEEYGGAGGSLFDLVILCEEMGKVGVSFPLTHVSACCRAIANQGSEDQKRRYLPDMAMGKKIGAYCQTEPNAGSDAGSMSSFAERNNGYYLLNGTKNFISNGRIASVFIVLAKTERNLEKPSRGIAMFIIDRDLPGVSVGKKEELMGRHSSSLDEVIFEDVKVPEENLLIPAGSGGFKEIMVEFNGERCGNSAFCVGFAQGAYARALQYCKERVQFGKPIAELQGIRWILAEMAIQIQAARLLVYDAVTKAERGVVIAREAAMAKKLANEMSVWVC